MKRRLLIWGLGLVIGLGVATGALVAWRKAVGTAALERAWQTADKLAGEGRWVEARAVLEDQTRRRGRPEDPAIRAQWARMEFRLAGGLKDFASIEALAAAHPELIATDEGAALWLWRLRRLAKDPAGAARVRSAWQGRERDAVGWACADIDGLINEGDRETARQHLATMTFSGPAAVPLALRRALLAENPAELTRAFEEAYRLDPTNADLRSLRAMALESSGQPAYARVDYVAALVADPKNPLRRDDLASFYLRQGEVAAAVQTWREGLGPTSPDFLWERAFFWSRVLGVTAPDATLMGETREGHFAGWLVSLGPKRFWDEAGYAALHLPATHAQREPAVTWLRVLEQLRDGEYAPALVTLQEAPAAAVAAAPALHAALRLTLAVRAGAAPVDTGIAWPVAPGAGHRWWDVLGAAVKGNPSASAELIAVARGPHAVVATLLAAGWTGPVCEFAEWAEAEKPSTPGWVQFGLLQARRLVEGPVPALAWAKRLPALPEIQLVRAQLQLAGGQAPAAVGTLATLSARTDDVGYAAGWTLATWQLEQGSPAEAEKTVTHSPRLQATLIGTELRGRAALAMGKGSEAMRLYTSIQAESLEAGAYLARSAYARRDWKEARRITEFWLERLPDNLELRANLAAITTAERAGGGR